MSLFFELGISAGCIVLYVGQGNFHSRTTRTLEFILHQAYATVDNLKNLAISLSAAKTIAVDSIFLAAQAQKGIDDIGTKISSTASILTDAVEDNAHTIQQGLDGV